LILIIILTNTLFTPIANSREKSFITVGVYENKPKIFTDPDGNIAGFWPDLLSYIAHKEDWNIKYIHGSWGECLERLLNGQIALNLNANVESTLKMLRRLMGEDIDLAWLPETNLWSVKMDPSQIDQILANLSVNARDAIDGVGKVTIETANMVFDAAYCSEHKGFVPGQFVMLAVSDNGCGMDKEILDKIFEPFFTTKDVDKGTGLGLSMVYGIVKQNNGFINVYSEPGKGTTIKIYLPRHEGKMLEIQGESTANIPQGSGETILLVEDDLSILNLTEKILNSLNYEVLATDTCKGAMTLAQEHADGIHLLVTDVIMPEMNGRELSERLKSLYPDLKCMFMSGYTANAIAHHGVLDEGVSFIQKPFSKRDLAAIVRKILDME